jgi:ribonucleoside-diphosphate reductase alpha chain
VFRRGGDVSFVAEELKAVFDPRGGAWVQGKYVPSLLAAIGGVIERHLGSEQGELFPSPGADAPPAAIYPACPHCGSASLIKLEGCNNCLECGYSKCG